MSRDEFAHGVGRRAVTMHGPLVEVGLAGFPGEVLCVLPEFMEDPAGIDVFGVNLFRLIGLNLYSSVEDT